MHIREREVVVGPELKNANYTWIKSSSQLSNRLLTQCDHMLESKVAQFPPPPKIAQKQSQHFLVKREVFQSSLKSHQILGLILYECLLPCVFKNSQIWSHWPLVATNFMCNCKFQPAEGLQYLNERFFDETDRLSIKTLVMEVGEKSADGVDNDHIGKHCRSKCVGLKIF